MQAGGDAGGASPAPTKKYQIKLHDLKRKNGEADMETADGDVSLSGGRMERARSDDVGEGLAPPVPNHRRTNVRAVFLCLLRIKTKKFFQKKRVLPSACRI